MPSFPAKHRILRAKSFFLFYYAMQGISMLLDGLFGTAVGTTATV